MPVPLLNGLPVFGTYDVSMRTQENPRSIQLNAFHGLNGIEALDGGLRGRYTEVEGVLRGSGYFGLATAEETLRAYNNGRYYTMVDTRGVTWLYVRLESFEPQGKSMLDAYGIGFRRYRARLHHLT